MRIWHITSGISAFYRRAGGLTLGFAAGASLLTTIALPVSAQDSLVLEEVLVTARKRSESIQDAPLAVTSIAAELREASLRRLDDLQNFTPNLYIRNTAGIPGGAAVSIRGVSSSESDKSFDPNIGIIMDGMFIGTSSGALLHNFDIDRIEILRGPQGTLFGKNTTGGVINIVRGAVTGELGGDISLTLGEDGRRDVKAVLNLPQIGNQLGIKLFANSIQSDGFVRNITFNDEVGGDDFTTFGFAARWEPTENFDLQFHYERNQDDSEVSAYVNLNQAGELACILEGIFYPIACATSDPSAGDPDLNSTNGPSISDSTTDNYILTANWDLDSVLLTSITTFRDLDEFFEQEFDGSPANFLDFDYFNDWEQFSQELRISTQIADSVDIVAGVYYWDVDYVQDWDVRELHFILANIGAFPGPLTPTTVVRSGQRQETTSIAAFFSGDWHINDQWTLTAGVRWTEEEKDFVGAVGIPWDPAAGDSPPALTFQPFSGRWTDVTPKVGVRYRPNEDLTFFASYTEGFKSGGFFGRQANFDIDPTFEPEFVETIELGMKSTLLGGRMTFNPTVFISSYEDKQESILIPVDLSNVATVVRNAASLDIFGVELELQYQITEAWDIRASYGYLDAEYDDYLADINGDQMITDNSDLESRNTPENTFGLTTNFTMAVGPGDLKGMLSFRWRDEIDIIANNDPLGHLDSITDLSSTLTYLWGGGKYRVTAYGRNLTDERELNAGIIDGLTSRGWWNEGRTIGAEFAYSF